MKCLNSIILGGGYNEQRNLDYSITPMTLTGSIWRYIFATDKFGRLRFDEDLHYAEDTFFAQTVALHRPSCLHAERKCYIYHDNPNSVMAKRDYLKSADSMLRLAENHKRYLDENRFPDDKERVEIWCARATAGYIYYSLRGGRQEDPFPMLKGKGLWPYKKEWTMLKIYLKKNGGIKQTVSNYCLLLCGFKMTWRLLKWSGVLR